MISAHLFPIPVFVEAGSLSRKIVLTTAWLRHLGGVATSLMLSRLWEKTEMRPPTDRILTTHTGSLPRPPELVKMLLARDGGQEPPGFEAAASEATSDIVKRQIAAGIDIVNDGEMAKLSYSVYVKDRLEGFSAEGAFPPFSDLLDFPEYAQRMFASSDGSVAPLAACNGAVSWKDPSAFAKDIARMQMALKGHLPRDVFMTAASPGVIALFLENKFYETHEAYLDALADVMKLEYEAIYNAGFILQLDCPDLGAGGHTRFAQATTAEFVPIVEAHLRAIERATANIPTDRIRIHLCWGNYEGPHHHDVELRHIIEPILNARVGAISFEASNPRHEHEWVVFERVKLPSGKILIPGVIDTSTNYIEHPDLVAQRIVRYARLVGRENVIAGSDCGLATFATEALIDPAISWAKLRSLSQGAAIASRELW